MQLSRRPPPPTVLLDVAEKSRDEERNYDLSSLPITATSLPTLRTVVQLSNVSGREPVYPFVTKTLVLSSARP